MSAPAPRPAPPGRFARVYYPIWGLATAMALTYLASFALTSDFRLSAGKSQEPTADPAVSLRIANQAMSEVGSVQRSVMDIRRDVGALKQAAEQRDAQDREAQARLASLEEKVTTLASGPAVATAPEPVTHVRSVEKGTAAADKKAAARRATARGLEPDGSEPAPAAETPAPRVETGSIAKQPAAAAAPKAATQSYSVQIGAGPSVDALRQSWRVLADRHGALALLKPRVVAPPSGSSVYRLVAGPLASKADAERVCADMAVGPQGCIPTTAVGTPL